MRKVADLLGISHTMVNHLEIGRANISEDYVQKFLKTLNYNEEDCKTFNSVPIISRQGEINFSIVSTN